MSKAIRFKRLNIAFERAGSQKILILFLEIAFQKFI